MQGDWCRPARGRRVQLVPGALLLDFPVERARLASDKLMDAVDRFIDGAMARVVSAVGLDDHDPEIVEYIGVFGRT